MALPSAPNHPLPISWLSPQLVRRAQSPLVWLLVGLIWVYRATLSPFIGQYCRFQPTCSRYAEEAIRKYGPLRGLLLSANRLRKCHPWGPFGPDPVP